MKIHGFQKLTLLDFPGKTACTVFTPGCPFRCPFCHNAPLVTEIDESDAHSPDEILSFLKKRIGLLDGVCLTGGEPLLQPDLADFLAEIKAMGFAVKLDSNGGFPERLQQLAKRGLIDYVAMDIKNTPERYAETVGLPFYDTAPIEESIAFLKQNTVPYEFRTTVVAEFHTVADIEAIASRIAPAPRYFLQNFVDSGRLIGQNLHAVSRQTLFEMKQAAEKYLPQVEIRGV